MEEGRQKRRHETEEEGEPEPAPPIGAHGGDVDAATPDEHAIAPADRHEKGGGHETPGSALQKQRLLIKA